MALQRAIWTYEFNTKMNLCMVFRQFFGMPKILEALPKLLPKRKNLTGGRSYDGIRSPHDFPDNFAIRSEFEHFLYRVSI